MWPDIEKLPDNLRLIVIDGRSVSVPGAAGTSYRLHLAMDGVTLSFIHVEVKDQYVGESLNHYPLTKNDVVLHLSPHAMPLYQSGGDKKLDLYEILKHAKR